MNTDLRWNLGAFVAVGLVNMASASRTGRLAGLLWLVAVVTGGFGFSYVRGSVFAPGDAAATVANIASSEAMFRAAIVGNLLCQVFMVLFGVKLYQLFVDAKRELAVLLLASILVSSTVAVCNTFNLFGALIVVTQPEYLATLAPDQRSDVAMFFLRLGGAGQGLLEVFWAPIYISFGLLVVKTRALPRVLGILLMIMGSGYVLNLLQKYLAPDFHPAAFTQMAMSLGALGGIPTMLWLLIKGATEPVMPQMNADSSS